MPPLLRIDTRDPRPIWRQIEEGLVHLVAAGRLPEGDAVPSVRDLALELRVNPNTVAKAYKRLADQHVLEVRRGEGTFVARAVQISAVELRRRLVEAARHLASVATALGAPAAVVHVALDEALRWKNRTEREAG